MNSFNQSLPVPVATWPPTPAQPQFGQTLAPQPWQYVTPGTWCSPPQRHHGAGLFFFLTSLWLGGKALSNYQRARVAEHQLEWMKVIMNAPDDTSHRNNPTGGASVIPDYYSFDSPSGDIRRLTPSSKPDGVTPPTPLRAREITPAFGDGMFLVGVDVEPGTYRCNGIAGSSVFWQRCRSASGI